MLLPSANVEDVHLFNVEDDYMDTFATTKDEIQLLKERYSWLLFKMKNNFKKRVDLNVHLP